MRTSTSLLSMGAALIVAVTLPLPAQSASHQWRFNEIFSNADGTVQFIEMKECCGCMDETVLNGKWIQVVNASQQYTFTRNLTGNTANRHLLLATQAFAALPGAPTPDFIIPDDFLPRGGDTLEYWFYSAATWSYSGLPTDGKTSLASDGSTGINSPTNYAGETGSIDTSVRVTQASWGTLKEIWGIPPFVP